MWIPKPACMHFTPGISLKFAWHSEKMSKQQQAQQKQHNLTKLGALCAFCVNQTLVYTAYMLSRFIGSQQMGVWAYTYTMDMYICVYVQHT